MSVSLFGTPALCYWLYLTLTQHSSPQAFVNITTGSGQDKHTFTVHKSLICHYSAFFDVALRGGSPEDKLLTRHFEDVEGEIMGLLVDWLYLQRIQLVHGNDLVFHEN